ncbi:MAG: hypothetical protein ACKOBV_10590, partial [Candidatus Kapaibacterium sp.]
MTQLTDKETFASYLIDASNTRGDAAGHARREGPRGRALRRGLEAQGRRGRGRGRGGRSVEGDVR